MPSCGAGKGFGTADFARSGASGPGRSGNSTRIFAPLLESAGRVAHPVQKLAGRHVKRPRLKIERNLRYRLERPVAAANVQRQSLARFFTTGVNFNFESLAIQDEPAQISDVGFGEKPLE
jgi:hypothetical protein